MFLFLTSFLYSDTIFFRVYSI